MDVTPVNKSDGLLRQETGSGTSEKQKGFWDIARHGRITQEDVRRQMDTLYLSTGSQSLGRM